MIVIARPWILAGIWTLLVAAIAVGFAVACPAPWGPPEVPKAQREAIAPISGGPIRYNESRLASAIREPQNTWSNLAYFFAGALVILSSRRVSGRVFGVSLGFLGLGSGLYHASLDPAWRLVDVMGMYWVLLALLVLGVQAAFFGEREPGGTDAPSAGRVMLVGGAMAVPAFAAAIFRNDVRVGGIKPLDSTTVTVGGIAAGMVLLGIAAWRAIRRGRVDLSTGRSSDIWPALVLIVSLIAAVIGQLGDRVTGGIWPQGAIIQGHAVWHVAGALGAALSYELAARWTGDRGLFFSNR